MARNLRACQSPVLSSIVFGQPRAIEAALQSWDINKWTLFAPLCAWLPSGPRLKGTYVSRINAIGNSVSNEEIILLKQQHTTSANAAMIPGDLVNPGRDIQSEEKKLCLKHYSQFCCRGRAGRTERYGMRLYDLKGQRKYLTPAERMEFLQTAKDAPEEVRTFCGTLVYTGCRISEALALTAARVDLGDGVVVIESLKKRRKGVYRAVPVPPPFLNELDLAHDLTAARKLPDGGVDVRLWQWSRATAWRRVCDVMEAAGITGLHATPKGLRHGFGIKAVASNVPLNMTQRWLGHAQLSTTAIYLDAVGVEEKQIAERMWK